MSAEIVYSKGNRSAKHKNEMNLHSSKQRIINFVVFYGQIVIAFPNILTKNLLYFDTTTNSSSIV